MSLHLTFTLLTVIRRIVEFVVQIALPKSTLNQRLAFEATVSKPNGWM